LILNLPNFQFVRSIVRIHCSLLMGSECETRFAIWLKSILKSAKNLLSRLYLDSSLAFPEKAVAISVRLTVRTLISAMIKFAKKINPCPVPTEGALKYCFYLFDFNHNAFTSSVKSLRRHIVSKRCTFVQSFYFV
jgi:hypothetical protein